MGTRASSTRRDFVKGVTAGAASLPAVSEAQRPGGAERKPNLLFVFTDQQSFDMLGCYGNRQVITPNLDRFAKQGVKFNHCIANSPLCTPYRGLLLSGQHSLWNGAMENDIRMLPQEGKSFGETLRGAGYRMGYIGKWHLYGGDRVRPIPPGPFRYGFDHTFLSNNCTLLYDAERAYYWDEEGNKRLYGEWEPYGQARQAMKFIDENAEHPFALFVSWHPPHSWVGTASPRTGPEDGYAAPEDLMKLYEPGAIRLRGNCADTPSARGVYRGHMAMCTSADRAFGWLMDKLDQKGLAANTIVVFTSDHGDTILSHGLLSNKMRPEIESIKVPFLIRYPKVLESRESELLLGTLDLMPTLLGLMGVPAPGGLHGRDLSSAILERRDGEVESVPLFVLPLDWRGVYTRRHTYSYDTSGGIPGRYRTVMFSRPAGLRWDCLYDHENDRWELQNLFDHPDSKKLREQLHEQTRTWMKRFGDNGVPYRDVQKAAFSAEDYNLSQDVRRMQRLSGLLKGRPVDLQ